MISLPTLRRKIFSSFSIIVLFYAILGIFLVSSVFLASSTTPTMIHVNYDSIAAANQMREAWNALDRPDRFQKPRIHWISQFEKALNFEEGNITEPGEKQITAAIRQNWNRFKEISKSNHTLSVSLFEDMHLHLNNLVSVNESGMFKLTEENVNLSHKVLLWSIFYFLITLFLSLLIADGLATRLSRPIKSIAESLQKRPGFVSKLKLIEPNSLELLILTTELSRLWDQVVETQNVNIMAVVQQKQKLEIVLESVEDALLVIDSTGKVSHCNQCMLSLIELTSNQVQGQIWTDLSTTHENYINLRSTLSKTIQESVEISLQLNHSQRQFTIRSRNISNPSGIPISTLFLLHDITDKKQRDHFRSDFIDLLSHEIKTPLQSLGTASEFLSSHQEQLPEIILPFVETIAEDVERIRAVANEFIQVTQSHSKIMKLKLEMVAVNQILPEWIKPFKIISKDRNVKIYFHQEGSELIWAHLDSVKFPWVISNLLSNAIRFSPEGGEVEIYLTDRTGCVEIQIKDLGPGITDEDQRRMFEPFYQSPLNQTGSQLSRNGLFGIGLTIAKEVVEAHDGRIEYRRRQPHGSEFRILLPFPPQNYT